MSSFFYKMYSCNFFLFYHSFQIKERWVGHKSHLLGHLQQGLVVTLPFGPPLCGFLLQFLDLLGHLEVNPDS